MNIFKGQNLIEFAERFQSDEDCKKHLSESKWEKGYVCRKCGHGKSQIRKDFSRTCNICSYTESSSANILFPIWIPIDIFYNLHRFGSVQQTLSGFVL